MQFNRKYNFSAGPAVLPIEVLQRVKENILSYKDSGLGVMELSHRGGEFKEIIEQTEANFRELLKVDDSRSILFMTGGATHQFSAVPQNLGRGKIANYILTGSWAKKALKEASLFGETHVAATTEESNFSSIPQSINLSENAAYLHFTSNNTISGTQFTKEPEANGCPLICDASSDILSKNIDINKYGVLYAGSQKNLGPAGVTVVIIQNSLLEKIPSDVPTMSKYSTYAESASLYNTPPTFPIYVVGEVLNWIKEKGGLTKVSQDNQSKAQLLYTQIDSGEFYTTPVEKDSRSLMNVVFRLKDESLEKKFISEADKAGFSGLKGHRSVGGMRASIYNAFPREGVEALVDFMKEFERTNG